MAPNLFQKAGWNPGMDDSQHGECLALSAKLKVLSRWAPHARHDVVGACSPISLDLSLLGVKSKRATLSPEDIATFIARGKENIKNTVEELNRVILLQRQDRAAPIAVCDMMEKMARATRTVFVAVDWSPPTDPATLGTDSEYDLTMTIWAVLMALVDRHGTSAHLHLEAQRDQGRLRLGFHVVSATEESAVGDTKPVLPGERINFNEVRHLAQLLGFAFVESERGIDLVRASVTTAETLPTAGAG